MNATREEWRPVVGWEGVYEVSDHGRVRSLDRIIVFPNGRTRRAPGRILRTWTMKRGGYRAVGFQHDGRQQKALVHVLVLEAFVGPRPPGRVCCHNDGDGSNCRIENLRWDTYSENNLDLVRHGTHYQASKTHCSNGHEYTNENTRIYTGRGAVERQCRDCQRAYSASEERRQKRRDKARRRRREGNPDVRRE